MKYYWDTTAVINAAISPALLNRLNRGENVTRLHTLAEFFATMTNGVKYKNKTTGQNVMLKFAPEDCAAWIRQFAGQIQFEDVSKEELLDGLDKAQALSVQGGKVYDYWHALAADKSKADFLLTRNTKHFQPLFPKLQWP